MERKKELKRDAPVRAGRVGQGATIRGRIVSSPESGRVVIRDRTDQIHRLNLDRWWVKPAEGVFSVDEFVIRRDTHFMDWRGIVQRTHADSGEVVVMNHKGERQIIHESRLHPATVLDEEPEIARPAGRINSDRSVESNKEMG